MVARFAGATLGLLAFCLTITAGLWVRNPAAVTLSRGIFALFVFCLLGLVLGGIAQMVISEYARGREAELIKRYRSDLPTDGDGSPTGASAAESQGESTETVGGPLGT